MDKLGNDWGEHFQTPQHVCEYMGSMINKVGDCSILEPTPGKGYLVKVLQKYGTVTAPKDFIDVFGMRFDWVVMNPPFSPMKEGYKILYQCMDMSDNIIALMPYLTIINGEKRTKDLMTWGLKSITHLPRSTFKGSRVQTCILEMTKGFKGKTNFRLM